MPSVEIYKQKSGDVSTSVDATIEADGRLQVIRNSFGPGNYETEVTAAVSAEDKDRLLLALLVKVFGGHPEALGQFRHFALAHDIEVSHFRWP